MPSTGRRLRETMCVGVVHVTLVLSTPPPDPRGNLGSKRGVITHPQTSQNPKILSESDSDSESNHGSEMDSFMPITGLRGGRRRGENFLHPPVPLAPPTWKTW